MKVLPTTSLLLAAAALLPGAAAAAPPWSAPTTTGTADPISAPMVAFASGDAVTAWPAFDGKRYVSYLVGRRSDGFLYPQVELQGEVLDLRRLGTKSLLMLRRQWSGTSRRITVTPSAEDAMTYAKPQTVASGRSVEQPALATDNAGRAVIAWSEGRSLRLRERSAAGKLGRVRVLARADGISGISVVMREGRWAVSWGQRVKRTFTVRAARARFGRTPVAATAGRHDGRALTAVALAAAGRVQVLWDSQDGGEEAERTAIVRTALWAPAASRFATAVELDRGTAREHARSRPQLLYTDDGRTSAAWVVALLAADGVHQTVRTAVAGTDGSFGPVSTLSSQGAVGSLVAGEAGSAWLSFAEFDGGMDARVLSSYRGSGSDGFGAGEEVSTDGSVGHGVPALAVDTTSGRPLAVWNRYASSASAPERIALSMRG